MTERELIRLVFFLLPLGLDTFALSTRVGMTPLPPTPRRPARLPGWHRSTPAAKRKEAILAGVRDHPISDSIVGEAQRAPSVHKTPLLCCKLTADSNGALLGGK